ncbi:MAG: sigma-54-dependent Fis family transcriptional regulator, partial [Gammaproteobacteria bacterium]|nr:sigma-54-dependent Fis family transcriptional regulator [Gammaproteobacteria bacterium]
PTHAAVLITGETGVGKEVIARAIHAMSPRWNKKFIAVNCGAIPEGLIESHLFGHERGAFTNAYEVHHGFFERAEGGTLFLDEIDSLPLPAQVRLLRVLETREFERVGAQQILHADVRIVAAGSNRLEAQVRQGQFRLDLYYRLNVVPIYIPPLRERRSDIPPLVAHILSDLAAQYQQEPKTLSREAMFQAMAYDWPGNVRELKNVLERAFLFSKEPVIHDLRLPVADRVARDTGPSKGANLRMAKKQAADKVEVEILRETLRLCQGNVRATAKALGMTPRALHQKLRFHQIDPDFFRSQRKSRTPLAD